MKIPLVDLKKQYLMIKNEINDAISRVLSSTKFIQCDNVRKFEEDFAIFLTNNESEKLFCKSCGNGTDALFLALKALNIKENDEVITVSHTFAATVEAIKLVGAKPVFVDIEEKTMLMDTTKIEKLITDKTKAIIVVHLYGQSCNMDELSRIAKKYNLLIIEDAAQAHGALWKNIKVGTFGDAACFSFFPGKNLGAYGDGGAVVSKNKDLIAKVSMLANHGRSDKYNHEFIGINSRLDSIQAAILLVKLKYLSKWNSLRHKHANYYLEALKNIPSIELPFVDENASSVWHLFVIKHDKRDFLLEKLKEENIFSHIHYPIPVHLQKAYLDLSNAQNLKITEKIVSKILSLPLYPEMDQNQQDKVIKVLRKHL